MPTSVESTEGFELAVIDGFAIDCLVSDSHTFESEITEFPVESGSTISDNIRNKPLVVQMEGIVSNTPLELANRFRKEGSNPADDAYAMFLAIRADRRLVSISTSLKTYDNMGLQSVSFPRASGRGDALQFNATFKQVDFKVNKREKRVSTVAARSGGSSPYTVIVQKGTISQVVDPRDSTWFDFAVGGFRQSAQFDARYAGTGAGNSAGSPTAGKWLLTKGRPLVVPLKEWLAYSEAQVADPVLRKRVLRDSPTQAYNFGSKTQDEVSRMPELQTNQYVIVGLRGQLATGQR